VIRQATAAFCVDDGARPSRGLRRATISKASNTRAGTQRLRDLALLRQVSDHMDREHAQPLDVEALARGITMSAG
jgi:hypothetical protein